MQNNQWHPNQHFIDGQWFDGQGEEFHSINPATQAVLWEGRQATDLEVEMAVSAAHKAYLPWSKTSFEERARFCENFAKRIKEQKNDLAELIAMESGKPLWEAHTEAAAVINKVALSIQSHQERTPNRRFPGATQDSWLRYKPHGVVAVLGAFNFPAHLANGHIVPALLAGNTVVLKPSELTPAVSQFMLQCWDNIGLPKGVINGVQGKGTTGQRLLEQDLQGVYFTGSFATGKRIHQHFSGRPNVILALEMGGNNPLIIDQTEHLNAAVYNSILSSMITSGQRCTCARRLFIPDNAFGKNFIEVFIKACKNLRVGPWNDQPEPFFGPVIRKEHANRHLQTQKDLVQQGGEPLLEMHLLKPESGFLTPGIIDMSGVEKTEDTEIFAPFVQIYRYKDFDEAIDGANQTQYGLSAGLISDDPNHYERFYTRVRAGLINWNKPTTGAAGNLPFGGVGHSGNHRPSAYFAADYCAYPVASVEQTQLSLPDQLTPGVTLG